MSLPLRRSDRRHSQEKRVYLIVPCEESIALNWFRVQKSGCYSDDAAFLSKLLEIHERFKPSAIQDQRVKISSDLQTLFVENKAVVVSAADTRLHEKFQNAFVFHNKIVKPKPVPVQKPSSPIRHRPSTEPSKKQCETVIVKVEPISQSTPLILIPTTNHNASSVPAPSPKPELIDTADLDKLNPLDYCHLQMEVESESNSQLRYCSSPEKDHKGLLPYLVTKPHPQNPSKTFVYGVVYAPPNNPPLADFSDVISSHDVTACSAVIPKEVAIPRNETESNNIILNPDAISSCDTAINGVISSCDVTLGRYRSKLGRPFKNPPIADGDCVSAIRKSGRKRKVSFKIDDSVSDLDKEPRRKKGARSVITKVDLEQTSKNGRLVVGEGTSSISGFLNCTKKGKERKDYASLIRALGGRSNPPATRAPYGGADNRLSDKLKMLRVKMGYSVVETSDGLGERESEFVGGEIYEDPDLEDFAAEEDESADVIDGRLTGQSAMLHRVSCEHCEEQVKSGADLREHMETHHGYLTCHLCGLQFYYRKEFALHRLTHFADGKEDNLNRAKGGRQAGEESAVQERRGVDRTRRKSDTNNTQHC